MGRLDEALLRRYVSDVAGPLFWVSGPPAMVTAGKEMLEHLGAAPDAIRIDKKAQQFAQAAGVTGVVITKLDGTARGGIAVAIARELGLPVKLIGVGEALEDLRPFDPDEFARALIAQ